MTKTTVEMRKHQNLQWVARNDKINTDQSHGGCSILHEFLQKVAQNDKTYSRDEKAPKFTVGSKK